MFAAKGGKGLSTAAQQWNPNHLDLEVRGQMRRVLHLKGTPTERVFARQMIQQVEQSAYGQEVPLCVPGARNALIPLLGQELKRIQDRYPGVLVDVAGLRTNPEYRADCERGVAGQYRVDARERVRVYAPTGGLEDAALRGRVAGAATEIARRLLVPRTAIREG